jgi:hypothetical protein
MASAAEVVDALHDGARVTAVFSSLKGHPPNRPPGRAFVVVELKDGRECIAFEGNPAPGRNVSDIENLDA